MLTKEEIKYINSINKEIIYNIYTNISGGYKRYENITRKQMVEDIYVDIWFDNYYLKRMVLKKDLQLLKEAINQGQTTIVANRNSFDSLARLNQALLVFNIKYPQAIFHIPNEVCIFFKNYDLSDFDERIEDFYYFINGLLFTRGIIKISEAKEIFSHVKPDDFQVDFHKTLEEINGLLLGLSFDQYEFSGYLMKTNLFIDLDIDNSIERTEYSFNEYLSYGKYGFNLTKEVDLEIYQIISDYLKKDFIFEIMNVFLTELNANKIELDIMFKQVFLGVCEGDVKKAAELIERLSEVMPRWSFKGKLKKDIKLENLIKFHEKVRKQKQKQLPTCVCGSADTFADCCGNKERLLTNRAILEDELGLDFYIMLNTFMSITNDDLEVFEVKNPNNPLGDLSDEQYRELKRITLEIVNDISVNPESPDAKLSDNDEMIYRGLKNNYPNTFIALEYIDQKLVLYDEMLDVKFLVSGINSPLSEGVPFYMLPAVVKTTLIPLENEIVYDVFMEVVNEQLDNEDTKKMLKETKNLDICSDFASFIEYVGIVEEISDDDYYYDEEDDDGDYDFVARKIERLELNKLINETNVKLIRLNAETINDYTNIWLEVLQSMRGVKSYRDALQSLNVYKKHFIEICQLTTVLDYRPLARVLEVDGRAVGFVSGILSYFESGIMFQIGTFGIAPKYRKKGYGKMFIEMLKEDMTEYNVNYLWLLPQNDGFWFKQGFSADLDIMHALYSLSEMDKPLILKLNDRKISFKAFLEMFCESNGEEIPYVRVDRSFK